MSIGDISHFESRVGDIERAIECLRKAVHLELGEYLELRLEHSPLLNTLFQLQEMEAQLEHTASLIYRALHKP